VTSQLNFSAGIAPKEKQKFDPLACNIRSGWHAPRRKAESGLGEIQNFIFQFPTANRHARSFPAAESARAVHERAPRNERGRRESWAPDAPAASRASEKSTRASHHRFTGSIRPSLRDGFNGFLRALPGEPGFLATIPSATRKRCRRVDASVGASGPHVFAVRAAPFVSRYTRGHRIPRSTFVTIAIRPSCSEAGRLESLMPFLANAEAKYF